MSFLLATGERSYIRTEAEQGFLRMEFAMLQISSGYSCPTGLALDQLGEGHYLIINQFPSHSLGLLQMKYKFVQVERASSDMGNLDSPVILDKNLLSHTLGG